MEKALSHGNGLCYNSGPRPDTLAATGLLMAARRHNLAAGFAGKEVIKLHACHRSASERIFT